MHLPGRRFCRGRQGLQNIKRKIQLAFLQRIRSVFGTESSRFMNTKSDRVLAISGGKVTDIGAEI